MSHHQCNMNVFHLNTPKCDVYILSMFLFLGSILVAVNPYRMFDIYGLDTVSRYEGRILGTLPPHLFAMGATAYNRLLAKDGQNQVRNSKSKQLISFFLSFFAVTKFYRMPSTWTDEMISLSWWKTFSEKNAQTSRLQLLHR